MALRFEARHDSRMFRFARLTRGKAAGSLGNRVFAANAAVLVAATLVLLLTPLTISFPVLLTEAAILGVGLLVMLAVDLWLVRRAFAPLASLAAEVRKIDPQDPPHAVEVDAGGEVRELIDAFNRMLRRLATQRRERGLQTLAAQEAERGRIARELHDQIGQQLTAVLLHLGTLHAKAPLELRAALEEAQETARATLEDVRRVAQRLRPVALDDLGLASALTALCASMQSGTSLRVQRRLAPDVPALSPEVELVVYRVAQESLTNAARHAHARTVLVELVADREAVRLSVVDDGRGLGNAAWGSGLHGMRERAELVGAELELTSTNGCGTAVRLRIPRDWSAA